MSYCELLGNISLFKQAVTVPGNLNEIGPTYISSTPQVLQFVLSSCHPVSSSIRLHSHITNMARFLKDVKSGLRKLIQARNKSLKRKIKGGVPEAIGALMGQPTLVRFEYHSTVTFIDEV